MSFRGVYTIILDGALIKAFPLRCACQFFVHKTAYLIAFKFQGGGGCKCRYPRSYSKVACIRFSINFVQDDEV